MSIILRFIPIKILKKYKIVAPTVSVRSTVDRTTEEPYHAGTIKH
jgi:hypothetical protein